MDQNGFLTNVSDLVALFCFYPRLGLLEKVFDFGVVWY